MIFFPGIIYYFIFADKMKFIITITLIVAASALPQPLIRQSAEDDTPHIVFRHWEPTPDLWRLSKPNKDMNSKFLRELPPQLANFKVDSDVKYREITPNDILSAIKIIHQIQSSKNDEEGEVVPNNDGSEDGQIAIPPNSDAPEDDEEADLLINDEIGNGQETDLLIINEPEESHKEISPINDEPEFIQEAISPNADIQNISPNRKIVLDMMKPEIVQVASEKEDVSEKQRSVDLTPQLIKIVPSFTSDGIKFIPSHVDHVNFSAKA